MNQSHRNTGRTTRMVEAAMDAARQGRAVYVVTNNRNHARELAHRYPQAGELGVKFETWDSLYNLNITTLKLEHAHPNCRVFVDHAAIEDRYGRLLEELHRYDS